MDSNSPLEVKSHFSKTIGRFSKTRRRRGARGVTPMLKKKRSKKVIIKSTSITSGINAFIVDDIMIEEELEELEEADKNV